MSTTRAGQWQDRIVAHSLGRRARGAVELHPTGLLVDRIGETPLWIPAASVSQISTTAGIAGKVMGLPDGILLLRWSWGGVEVDSGFRADDRDDQAEWIRAARRVVLPAVATPDSTDLKGGT